MKATAQSNSPGQSPQLSDILYRRPEELHPWPNNPRIHTDKQLTKLKASIRKFGFTNAVLIEETDTILSGHGRVEAAKQLGLALIPIRVIAGLTKDQKRAYVVADNKTAELSRWDNVALKGELELLMQADFELEVTGFSTAEIDVMFESDETPKGGDIDDLQAEDVATETVSRKGDLWQLGDHRLLCGDALAVESYEVLMHGDRAQMVFSDPPYNVPISGHVCGNGKVKHKEFVQASGEMSVKQFTEFLHVVFVHTHAFSDDGSIHYVCMDWRHQLEILGAAQPLFGPLRQLCVWIKDAGGMGTFYRSQHELVFVFKKGDASHINNFELGQHGRYRTNAWHYPGISHDLLRLHPTVKPTALVADAIRDCSHRKGIVLDPFSGGGTTIIAAERTGRVARAMELDPAYVDVDVLRWQRVTGKSAVLATTGQTWEEVRAERAVKDEEVGHV